MNRNDIEETLDLIARLKEQIERYRHVERKEIAKVWDILDKLEDKEQNMLDKYYEED